MQMSISVADFKDDFYIYLNIKFTSRYQDRHINA